MYIYVYVYVSSGAAFATVENLSDWLLPHILGTTGNRMIVVVVVVVVVIVVVVIVVVIVVVVVVVAQLLHNDPCLTVTSYAIFHMHDVISS